MKKSGTNPVDPRAQLAQAADSIRQYLEQERDEGVTAIEVDQTAAPASPGSSTNATVASGSSTDGVRKALAEVALSAAGCKKCQLHKTRTKVVPGQGTLSPEIMFIGEAPGFDEDQQGLAFVGAAGQLLTKMIEAMGLTRDQVFIANILKCRPPGNRVPLPEEVAACKPYLETQIAALRPRVLVLLGASAVRALLQVETGITRLRGNWATYAGIDAMPTFHPSYLLRMPSAKREAWSDLQAVLSRIGRQPPPKQK